MQKAFPHRTFFLFNFIDTAQMAHLVLPDT